MRLPVKGTDFITDPTFLTNADGVKSLTPQGADPLAVDLPAGATSWGKLTGIDNWTTNLLIEVIPGATYRISYDVRSGTGNTSTDGIGSFWWHLTADGNASQGYSNFNPGLKKENATDWVHVERDFTPGDSVDWRYLRPALRASGGPWLVTNFHVRIITGGNPVLIARDDVTVADVRDVSYTRRYYLLQASTLNPPTAPTVNPATGSWVTTEPAYTEGSTNTLYTVDLTVFSDGTFDYTPVSKSSSYEAAKQAYNKAVAAGTAASNANDKAVDAFNIANLADAAAKSMIKATATDPGQQEGRIWLQLDSSGRVIAVKISNGTAWATYTLMAGQVIVPGSIGTTLIADGGITTPKLNVTDSMNAKILNIGFADADGRTFLNGDRIRMWNTDGEVTIDLDATTGTATLANAFVTGTFRTDPNYANPGIEIRPVSGGSPGGILNFQGGSDGGQGWLRAERNVTADTYLLSLLSQSSAGGRPAFFGARASQTTSTHYFDSDELWVETSSPIADNASLVRLKSTLEETRLVARTRTSTSETSETYQRLDIRFAEGNTTTPLRLEASTETVNKDASSASRQTISGAGVLPKLQFSTATERDAWPSRYLTTGQECVVTSDVSANNGEYVLAGSNWVKKGRVFEWLNAQQTTYGSIGAWNTEKSQDLTLPAGMYQFSIGKRHNAGGEAGAHIELLQGSTVKYSLEWTSQYHENGIKNDWATTTMQVAAGTYTVRVQTVHWQSGFSIQRGLCTIDGGSYSRVATLDLL